MTLTLLTDARRTQRVIETREHGPHVVRTGWTEHDGRDRISIAVHFGLHYLRGNRLPHFSLTIGSGLVNGRDSFGGADHETIVREFPELADLAALHLSDIDGQPMHAEANGWYQLAGACGGFSERYHAGNAETYGRPRDCLQSFADHCRITREQAQAIADDVLAYDVRERESLPWAERKSGVCGRRRWRELCEGMRARWKQEAETAIAKYGLTVHGDTWKRA
jgi:hypothetical protein